MVWHASKIHQFVYPEAYYNGVMASEPEMLLLNSE